MVSHNHKSGQYKYYNYAERNTNKSYEWSYNYSSFKIKMTVVVNS